MHYARHRKADVRKKGKEMGTCFLRRRVWQKLYWVSIPGRTRGLIPLAMVILKLYFCTEMDVVLEEAPETLQKSKKCRCGQAAPVCQNMQGREGPTYLSMGI